MNTFNKWMTLSILIIILGGVFSTVFISTHEFSTLFSDRYSPKQYIVLEKYPVRIIVYGQLEEANNDIELTKQKKNFHNKLIEVIQALDKVKYEKGNFTYPISVSIDSNFNSKQERYKKNNLLDNFTK